jgi:hypothetical protein
VADELFDNLENLRGCRQRIAIFLQRRIGSDKGARDCTETRHWVADIHISRREFNPLCDLQPVTINFYVRKDANVINLIVPFPLI